MYITLIDPKNGFNNLPGFKHIDLADASLDLKAPSNVTQYNFVFQFLPIFASICSLIYGLDFVNKACDIALSQLRMYNQNIGIQTALCLRDIYEALYTIKTSNFRLTGYLDAAKTALSLVIGKSILFSCRKGLSLEWLFSHNTVINAQCLTHELQCKVFINYLIYWLYNQAKDLPEISHIRNVIIIDDAMRFIGNSQQFSNQSSVSQLGQMLAVLRSKGICCIFVSQLAAPIDPSVVSLCRNMLVIGNTNGEENLRVIQNFMSLTPAQKDAVLRFQPREMLAFISGSAWPYPVHGWAPFVEDLPTARIPTEDLSDMITPWSSLTEIPKVEPVQPQEPKNTTAPQSTTPKPTTKTTVDTLVYDCITFPFDRASVHAKRSMPSIREYDIAKTEAVQEGYLIPASCGKSLFLIPSIKAYEKFSQPCPFKRATSLEHGFFVALAAHLLKKDPVLSKVQMETPVGSKGAAIDITTVTKAGDMTAIEVTLSTSNLLSNASKLQDSAYQKIIWLARDAATAKAVQAYFHKSKSLPDELVAKFQYMHFSKFSKQYERKQ